MSTLFKNLGYFVAFLRKRIVVLGAYIRGILLRLGWIKPKMNQYQYEWGVVVKEIVVQSGSELDRYSLLLSEIVEPVLSRNKYYDRCKNPRNPSNSGICLFLEEIRHYINNKTPVGTNEILQQRLILFGELAYQFWLLGHKFERDYDSVLQKRLNESFRGSSYYDGQQAGFRQYEYEIQTICRLVEEGIPFVENTEQHEPDLTVLPDTDPFQVEIKLPLSSNPTGALQKAFTQINNRRGVVLISLDSALHNVVPEEKPSKVKQIATDLIKVLGERDHVAIVVEYYVQNETLFGWIGKRPTIEVATIMNALGGTEYTMDTLPSSLA